MSLISIVKKARAKTLPRSLSVTLSQVRWEIRSWRSHRIGRKKAKQFSGQQKLKLNIGCGPVVKPGWINIDLFPSSPEVLPVDLRQTLPFSAASASIVYGEHFLEHLEYPDEAQYFLSEAYRVLEPGGLLSLGVPDAEASLRAYVFKDSKFFVHSRLWHPDWCDTPMHHVNYTFRQQKEHKYAYDFETLSRVILNAGFCDVVRREFDDDLDSEERRIATLYVKARR
jgi:predicted SAM-dependent methyltransferase